MIWHAVDSSTLISFAARETGADIEFLSKALLARKVLLPPPVIAEVMSNRTQDGRILRMLYEFREMAIAPGYWQRAGTLRRTVLSTGRKARLGDALIAQSCIDHDTPLITRDTDFRHYCEHGLKLAE